MRTMCTTDRDQLVQAARMADGQLQADQGAIGITDEAMQLFDMQRIEQDGDGIGLIGGIDGRIQLTIGAENVITRGKNPFAPNASTAADGTVPYVRYEQDL